jgi:hypothetical protein
MLMFHGPKVKEYLANFDSATEVSPLGMPINGIVRFLRPNEPWRGCRDAPGRLGISKSTTWLPGDVGNVRNPATLRREGKL